MQATIGGYGVELGVAVALGVGVALGTGVAVALGVGGTVDAESLGDAVGFTAATDVVGGVEVDPHAAMVVRATTVAAIQVNR